MVETLAPIRTSESRQMQTFGRALAHDLAVSEYIYQLDQVKIEREYKVEFLDSLDYATILIRQSLFNSFADVLRAERYDEIEQAMWCMELADKYRRGMVDNILVGESGYALTRRIHEFILADMSFDYERKYMTQEPYTG